MKEVEETEYWLDICKHSDCIPDPPENLFTELESIKKILGKIISSSFRNGKYRNQG